MSSTSPPANSAEKQQASLKRALSLPLVTFYGLGNILGAGIYVLVGKVVEHAAQIAEGAKTVTAWPDDQAELTAIEKKTHIARAGLMVPLRIRTVYLTAMNRLMARTATMEIVLTGKLLWRE